MKFIILPLSYREKEEKAQKLKETVELAVKIKDRKQQMFTLAGLLVFSDKIMDQETAKRIRKVIEMTQVARLFEEEKLQAIRQTREQITKQMVEKMLKRGDSPEEIIAIVPGYSLDDVAAVK